MNSYPTLSFVWLWHGFSLSSLNANDYDYVIRWLLVLCYHAQWNNTICMKSDAGVFPLGFFCIFPYIWSFLQVSFHYLLNIFTEFHEVFPLPLGFVGGVLHALVDMLVVWHRSYVSFIQMHASRVTRRTIHKLLCEKFSPTYYWHLVIKQSCPVCVCLC